MAIGTTTGTAVFTDACRAIDVVLQRLTELLRRTDAASRPAIGSWSLAETASHISHVIQADTDAVTGVPMPEAELNPAAVRVLTAEMLADDPERDLNVLADRIDALGAGFVALSASPPIDPVTWLGGIQLPPSAVACHLLEELLVHGFDIASAARASWRIEPSYAALAILGAALPIIGTSPESWIRPGRAEGVRARIEFRLRGYDRFAWVIDDGQLSVEAPPAKVPADAYLSAAPAELLLVMLGRRNPWRALLGGKVLVWGRRPQAFLAMQRAVSPP
jgi:putative sterol carrier protein